MDRWTDSPATSDAPESSSPLRRLSARLGHAFQTLAAAAPLLRGGLVVALVACGGVFAMLSMRASEEPPLVVKPPTFTTVPTVRREPSPAAPASRANAQVTDPFFSPEPTPIGGRRFLAFAGLNPGDFCESLAALGFDQARWEPSQVFAGEWECASPLRIDGAADDEAFLVARGRGERAVGSLMLKMNPPSPDGRDRLAALAERVGELFASETHIVLSDEATALLRSWTAGDEKSLAGRIRLLGDRTRPGSLTMNLSADPLLPSPLRTCDARCFAHSRALASLASPRQVTVEER
ncbi:DUF6030 family protein [Aureimonas psammosilenae]|uniref:DUF6030 family protein n=1 Tax=Aureimonas psammosilenae TaxID=2495496 RepID=UPI0012603EBF|nr:DUF6030 family protein [Aureimonas psammosilenae]